MTLALYTIWLLGVGVFWSDAVFQRGLSAGQIIRVVFAGLAWPLALPLVLLGRRRVQKRQATAVPPWLRHVEGQHGRMFEDEDEEDWLTGDPRDR